MSAAARWYSLRRGRARRTRDPELISPPAINGSRVNNQVLTVTLGSWGYGNPVSYQWLRSDVDIAGATNNTYTYISSTDDTFTIKVRERAVGSGGETFATSASLA